MKEFHHIAVLDFGSQYTQLIVRKVRELGYYAKLYAPEDLADVGAPGAIILSGGPRSTSEPDAPDIDFEKTAIVWLSCTWRLLRHAIAQHQIRRHRACEQSS